MSDTRYLSLAMLAQVRKQLLVLESCECHTSDCNLFCMEALLLHFILAAAAAVVIFAAAVFNVCLSSQGRQIFFALSIRHIRT